MMNGLKQKKKSGGFQNIKLCKTSHYIFFVRQFFENEYDDN